MRISSNSGRHRLQCFKERSPNENELAVAAPRSGRTIFPAPQTVNIRGGSRGDELACKPSLAVLQGSLFCSQAPDPDRDQGACGLVLKLLEFTAPLWTKACRRLSWPSSICATAHPLSKAFEIFFQGENLTNDQYRIGRTRVLTLGQPIFVQGELRWQSRPGQRAKDFQLARRYCR